MNRRQVLSTLTIAAVVAGVGTSTLASAGTKHKVIKGAYTVTAVPDPTVEATDEAGMTCMNIDPLSADSHPLTVPAAGMLDVVLHSPTPASGPQGLGADWDLYILDAAGTVIDSSHGATAHEETLDPFAGKKAITIKVCNLLGEPNANVNWTFTYKK